MTGLRKAAEMALNAMLSEYSTGGKNKYSPWDVIEALSQALAQPEQKLIGWKDGEPQYVAQPEQEPKSISTNDHLCAMLRQVHDVLACTALPMKRPWVGLTDIDIHVLKMNHDKVKVVYTDHAKDLSVLGQDVDVNGLINAIETILKEKNDAV